MSNDIPSSASELSRQQRNKLYKVQEEEPRDMKDNGGSSSGSSKDGGVPSTGNQVAVKSYIVDDKTTSTAGNKQRSKSVSVPPPPLAQRGVSLEDKTGKPCAPVASGTQPLNYATLNLDDDTPPTVAGTLATSSANTSSPGKCIALETASPKPCPVEYTTIDHEKTSQLGKKGGTAN